MIDKDLYARGERIRREVMGDERVDASMTDLDDFNRDFMEQFITEMGSPWISPPSERRW